MLPQIGPLSCYGPFLYKGKTVSPSKETKHLLINATVSLGKGESNVNGRLQGLCGLRVSVLGQSRTELLHMVSLYIRCHPL